MSILISSTMTKFVVSISRGPAHSVNSRAYLSGFLLLAQEDIAAEFGIPVQCQRFWKWRKRPNHTYRPDMPLTPEEESKPVGELMELKEGLKPELNLFLESELGLDGHPVSPPVKSHEDIMLFLKVYDPEKGALRYAGRLFVKRDSKPSDIIGKLNEMAGFDQDEAVDIYEEIKCMPAGKCKLINRALSFQDNELKDGDMICFQKTMDQCEKSCRYTTIPSFLEHIRASQEMETEITHLSGRFIWKISNFSKLTSMKYYSGVFTIAGCKWEVIIYPRGDRIADHLAIYLQVADASSLPNGWSRTVGFSITVVDQNTRDPSIKNEASPEFNELKPCLGFSSFPSLTELHDKNKGYLVQDTLVVEANVVVLKAVHPVYASNSARDAARFISFFDSLEALVEAAKTSDGVESPSSGTQISDAVPIGLSLEEAESAKQFLKECLPGQFKLSMKERLASALSTLSVAQTGLSRGQKKSVLEFRGHFDEFISDHLILEQENSEYELLKVQKDQQVSSMKKNRGRHLLYKELSEKLAREEVELKKMLEETMCRNAKLISDWGALISKTEEAKSNYVSLEQKLAEAEKRKRIAEESMSRSTTAWSSLKAQFL